MTGNIWKWLKVAKYCKDNDDEKDNDDGKE